MKLKDIAKIKTGVVTARKKAKLTDADTSEYSAITLKSFAPNGKLQHENLDTFVSKGAINSKYFSKENDMIVRLREPVIALHLKKSDENLLIPSLIAVIKVERSKISSRFLAYYLNSKIAQRALSVSITGTTINMIQTKVLGELTLHLPSLERQNKIADYLDLANREIELLEALKQEKEKQSAELFNILLENKGK